MPKRKVFPEILKRMSPVRFVPLPEINLRKEYYLSRFVEKLLRSSTKTQIREWRVKKMRLYNKDLRHLFHDIALIVSRINRDGSRFNRREELFDIAHNRSWTDSEEEEMENLDLIVDFFLLDVRSLLIFINVFMDKLARFLALFITKNGEQISQRSFYSFQDVLAKLEGDEIRNFSQLVNDYTRWFKDVKKWRDQFVIHDPGAGGAIVFKDGRAYAALTRREGGEGEPKYIIMDSRAEDIPVDRIDEILYQLKEFLKVLDEYLCSHINTLPIEGEAKQIQLAKTDRAYLAGLFDGEGCANATFKSKKKFSKRKQKEVRYFWPTAQLAISGAYEHLQSIKETVGFGGVYKATRGKGWDFRTTQPKEVLKMIDIILPYVKLKKKELLLLKEAALFISRHKRRSRWSDEEKKEFHKRFVLPLKKEGKLGRPTECDKPFI